MDKLEIIKIAEEIGTYDISIRPYEDCCTVFTPASPATKPKREKANRFEAKYDFTPLIDGSEQRNNGITNGRSSSGRRNKTINYHI